MTQSVHRGVPKPAVMPVDREKWLHQLNLSNFINSYYEYRDLHRLENCTKVLIVGPGQGLDKQVLKWRGYDVTTFDIDETFEPDHVGSVHDLSCFDTGQFDAVIASHVLEHLPEPYLNGSLKELARISRHSLIYLPIRRRHCHLRIVPGFKDIDLSLIFDIFNPFERPDGITPKYMEGQHYWEIGMRGYRVSDLVKRFSQFFRIISVYRNRDWIGSQNFVLGSKFGTDQGERSP